MGSWVFSSTIELVPVRTAMLASFRIESYISPRTEFDHNRQPRGRHGAQASQFEQVSQFRYMQAH